MTGEFDIFRNTRAEVFEASGISGYGTAAEMTLLYVISADIQPISGSVDDKEYSLTEERRMRMFYSGEHSIAVGNFIRTDGVMYRVEYVEKRSLGAMAVLKEVI